MTIRRRKVEALKNEIRDAVRGMLEAHERELLARLERKAKEGQLDLAIGELCELVDLR